MKKRVKRHLIVDDGRTKQIRWPDTNAHSTLGSTVKAKPNEKKEKKMGVQFMYAKY